ncbi:MAG: DUF1292 domain-containing protein, partial [Alicyclobacillus sp.]|nr:DUF1292 domain-containing protein [Alicyclobacillus sp.]
MGCTCGQETCGCTPLPAIQLLDESGQVHTFYVTDRIELHGQAYVLAYDPADGQCALLKVVRAADGSERLCNISDESEWDALRAT